MGYPTKVQLIDRKQSKQWYINFPAAIAQAMDFEKGEDVKWTIADKGHLILSREDQMPLIGNRPLNVFSLFEVHCLSDGSGEVDVPLFALFAIDELHFSRVTHRVCI